MVVAYLRHALPMRAVRTLHSKLYGVNRRVCFQHTLLIKITVEKRKVIVVGLPKSPMIPAIIPIFITNNHAGLAIYGDRHNNLKKRSAPFYGKPATL